MPFFRSETSQRAPSPPPSATSHSRGRGSSFGCRTASPDNFVNGYGSNSSGSTRTNSTRSGGFFSRRRSSSSNSSSRLSGLKYDLSIMAARQKATDAESAETAADRALNEARAAVRSAKDHVHILEQEALEEWVFNL